MTTLGMEAWERIDCREINDLMTYWKDDPPAHIALGQLRDVVIKGLGGEPPERSYIKPKSESIEEFALKLGVVVPPLKKEVPGGR